MSLMDKIAARQAAKNVEGGEQTGQAAAVAARMQEDQQDRDSVILLMSQVEEDEEQARKTFEGLEELAESIRVHRQQQPIVVIQIGPYRFKVSKGARRYRAMRDILKSETIRATIDRKGLEVGRIQYRLGQLHENIQRHDYKPFELAAEFQLLLDETKWTHEQLAKEVGVTKGWISKKLSLLKAPPEIQAAIKSGEMAETDYYNNKEQKKAEVATKREKPGDGEGGAAGAAPKTPKNFSMSWVDSVEHARIVAALMTRTGFKDVAVSPEPDKEELTAFYARVKEIWSTQ